MIRLMKTVCLVSLMTATGATVFGLFILAGSPSQNQDVHLAMGHDNTIAAKNKAFSTSHFFNMYSNVGHF